MARIVMKFGGTSVADLDRILAITATRLADADAILFEPGDHGHVPVREAVLASAAAPTMFPAVAIGGATSGGGGGRRRRRLEARDGVLPIGCREHYVLRRVGERAARARGGRFQGRAGEAGDEALGPRLVLLPGRRRRIRGRGGGGGGGAENRRRRGDLGRGDL